jgi:drug/metabolite transporter (DMT)-like permease
MSLAVIGQFLLKKGVLASSLTANLDSIFKTIFSPYVFFGFFVYAASSIIWLFVLQKFPLSVAYPALSLTYVVIVILSIFLLKEPVTSVKIAGMFFIVLGVYFLFK